MLSHYNLAYDLMSAPTVLKVHTDDIFFSVLPVHHTYECTCAFLMPLYKGASIAFCQGLKYITKNMDCLLYTSAFFKSFAEDFTKVQFDLLGDFQ